MMAISMRRPQGNACTVHDATQDVAPEIIGAQQVGLGGPLQAPIQILGERIVGAERRGEQRSGEEEQDDK
jgi:hypothetical protein